MISPAKSINLRNYPVRNLNEIIDHDAAGQFGDHSVVLATLKTLLNQPVYEVTFDANGTNHVRLVDAITGNIISPIDKTTAGQIAIADFSEDVEVRSIEWIESAGPHSEYRGKELPAYRVVLDHPSGTAIYVSADRGVVTSRRNTQWRMFDFFWMLHTMDYQGRDNFNSWLLRGMSVFGVVTVISGFGLGLVTTGWVRKTAIKSGRNQSPR